ncbi:hypothetical protein SAMN02745674_00841 [Lysobacter spongiicola DSM 21749]|uniref:Uncharacterized protein n=1 Tax=Lysobacter spongiicola DSM 21749 TaxID=1122188 RepID=A0A1T4NCQ7_9GAMM|nr:hypothetical protein SAMN02745674_00841 [Lysobacter spongiicola DSM 21749]
MGDACCGSTVDIRALEARQRRVLMIVLAINLATFAMMFLRSLWRVLRDAWAELRMESAA